MVSAPLPSVIVIKLPQPDPTVVFKPVSSGAVLLQMENEIYYGLNHVGALIWQLLPPECAQMDELCERMVAEFPDVPLETIQEDVTELLEDLGAQKLVVHGPAA